MRILPGLCTLLTIAACRGPSRVEQPRGSSAIYDDPAMWLCRPDLPNDSCHGNLDATELHADGTRTVIPFVAPTDSQVDCFYIYPTVDLDVRAGNHTDFKDLDRIQRTARAQIARFSEVCNVYAPLYRQVTIGTYFDVDGNKRYFDVAYSDVAAAFHHFLAHYDRGHKIVIVGHSQGAQMAARLLHDTFDQNAALRARLLVGMPIGYDANVPDGALVGGTFEQLQPCASDDQVGCIVAYRSIAVGDTPSKRAWKLPPGRRAFCVNPAGATATTPVPLISEAPAREFPDLHVTTGYVLERDYYRARCVADPNHHDYLEISESHLADDKRPEIIKLDTWHGPLGLHIYDFQFPQGDLIELIRKKAARAAQTSVTSSPSVSRNSGAVSPGTTSSVTPSSGE